jgi:outer membrane biosynthesis protein TonB
VTDGSGLIDIRALASAHKTMKSGGDDHSASVDPFTTGTMAMPALMPMGSHRSNKPIIIGGVVAAVIFLVMGSGLIYILMTRDTNAQPQIIKEQVIVREVIKEQGDDGKAAQEAAEAEKAALAAVAKEEPATENSGATEKTSTTKRSTTSKSTASTPPKEESKPAEETKVVASSKKKEDNIDNLLAQLDSKEESKPATKTKTPTKTASSGGKTELTRDDVQNVIRANSGRISTCHKSQNSGKLSGTLRVKFLIKPNGSVSNAEILTGTFAGTDVGSCVQKAVSGMKFPATSASTDFPVTYPFKLE